MPTRERILVGGSAGSGKSYGWLTIARMLKDTGATFHVIDPDDGVIRIWENEFPELKNINYYFTPTWFGELKQDEGRTVGGVAPAFADIKKKVKANDWVIVEMLGNLWSIVQASYVDEIFKEGIGDYFLQARKDMKAGAKRLDALSGWVDWGVINKLHNDNFMIPACYQLPVHVYMTTSVSQSMESKDSKESPDTKGFYEGTSIRLDGQKHNPFRMQSIFLFGRQGQTWSYSTFIKDRGRNFVNKEELVDFGAQYLCGVAGWKVS